MVSGETETMYYYHFDGLGSVVALSDENQNIVEQYEYDVFGEPNRTSDVNNPYMFTGRRYDEEAEFYYYRARYYRPNIGRFLQTDPIGYDDGLDMYAYVGNNPIGFVDSLGLCKEQSLWDRWEDFVQSSGILNSIGGFTIGALERVYDLEQAALHPVKSLGNWTVNTLEDIYDSEVAAYDVLYDLGYHGTSSDWYQTWHDIGSGRSTLGKDLKNIVSESDLLSADPYTAGHAWGGLTVDAEVITILSHVRVKIHKNIHGAHHKFPFVGKKRHLQATIYIKTVDNSGMNIRVPLRK